MSTVESHAWVLLLLILDVVLINVLSTARVDEYQIRLLLELRLLMLKRERQWQGCHLVYFFDIHALLACIRLLLFRL